MLEYVCSVLVSNTVCLLLAMYVDCTCTHACTCILYSSPLCVVSGSGVAAAGESLSKLQH